MCYSAANTLKVQTDVTEKTQNHPIRQHWKGEWPLILHSSNFDVQNTASFIFSLLKFNYL